MVIIDFSNHYCKLLFYNVLNGKYTLSYSGFKQQWAVFHHPSSLGYDLEAHVYYLLML